MTRKRAGTFAASAMAVAAALVVVTPRYVQACGVGTSFILSGGSGAPNSTMTATGVGFADAPVQIRLGSGQILASTHGPSFSHIPFTVPNVTAGSYFIEAWDGVGAMYVTTTLTVTAPVTAPQGPSAPGGSVSGPGGPPSAPGGTSSSGSPATSTNPQHPATAGSTAVRQVAPSGALSGVSQSAPVAQRVGAPVAAPPGAPAPEASVALVWRGVSDDVASGLAAANQPAARSTASATGGQHGNGMTIAALVLLPLLAVAGAGAVAVRRRKSEAVR